MLGLGQEWPTFFYIVHKKKKKLRMRHKKLIHRLLENNIIYLFHNINFNF